MGGAVMSQVSFSPSQYNTFIEGIRIPENNAAPNAFIGDCLDRVRPFIPTALGQAAGPDLVRKLAAMVCAGGTDPRAQRIAALFLQSAYLNETQSTEDISAFCTTAHHLRPPEGAPGPSAEVEGPPFVSVADAKKEMVVQEIAASRPLIKDMIIPGAWLLGSGAVFSATMLPILIILFVGAAGPMAVPLLCLGGVLTAVALIGFGFSLAVVLWRRHCLNRDMARAGTLEAVAQLFYRLEPKAQAFLFDRLGPHFRELTIEANSGNRYLREFGGLFDVLNDAEASDALKAKAWSLIVIKE